MAGDVDDIVGAAEDIGVAVLVADRPIERGVEQFLEMGKIALQKTRIVAPDRGHATRRQRRHGDEYALFVRRAVEPGRLVDHAIAVAEIRQAR